MPPRSIYLETFGCQMNELDSQLVSGQLRSLGYTFVPDPAAADVVLYNTCSVREKAEQKVWSRLGELRLRKADQPNLVVGVLGCMAERDGEDLIRRMPVVDILCGPGELDKLPTLLDNALRTRLSLAPPPVLPGEVAESARPEGASGGSGTNGHGGAGVPPASGASRASPSLRSARQIALQGNTSRRSATLAAAEDTLELLDLSRAVSPTDHNGSAYVRITRGCNKFCTYCVVPFTRGAEVHRPPDHIVEECKRLADSGVVEVTLLGQTVNHYRFEHGSAVTIGGITQPQKGRSYTGGHKRDPFSSSNTTTFANLLSRIHDEVPAIQRLRFVTSYPRDFGDDVLEVIRDHPRICRYLHVPAQSGSNRILKLMNRGYTIEEYLDFLGRARAHLHQPEIGRPLTIAGDIIVGFPTETDDDHRATAALLGRAQYKNAFIFKYSPRPGTAAYDKLPDDVPETTKRRRNNELLALQQRISEDTSRSYIGSTVHVFVEGISHREQRRARSIGAAGSGGTSVPPVRPISLTLRGLRIDPDTAATTSCTTIQAHIPSPGAATGPIQLSGRTDGDLIVFFDCPPDAAPDNLIGTIVPITITSAQPLALLGDLAAS